MALAKHARHRPIKAYSKYKTSKKIFWGASAKFQETYGFRNFWNSFWDFGMSGIGSHIHLDRPRAPPVAPWGRPGSAWHRPQLVCLLPWPSPPFMELPPACVES